MPPRLMRDTFRTLRFDEVHGADRRRGVRVGWIRWAQPEPPFHYEWRWWQLTLMTWPANGERAALKVQVEVKTYRTAGTRSIRWSKRYLRLSVCL